MIRYTNTGLLVFSLYKRHYLRPRALQEPGYLYCPLRTLLKPTGPVGGAIPEVGQSPTFGSEFLRQTSLFLGSCPESSGSRHPRPTVPIERPLGSFLSLSRSYHICPQWLPVVAIVAYLHPSPVGSAGSLSSCLLATIPIRHLPSSMMFSSCAGTTSTGPASWNMPKESRREGKVHDLSCIGVDSEWQVHCQREERRRASVFPPRS